LPETVFGPELAAAFLALARDFGVLVIDAMVWLDDFEFGVLNLLNGIA
jgi:hypothetical protein